MKKLLFFIALIFTVIFSNAQCPNPSGRLINYGIEIIWEDDNSFDPITLYYSKDGDFTNGSAYYGVKSPFLITQYNDFNFIRLGRNNNYSEIIVFKLNKKNTGYEIYDLEGNKLLIEPVGEIFIKVNKNKGIRDKIFISN